MAASAPPAQRAALPARLPFLDERAKARAVQAVVAFESHTSAELVITVRKAARSYPEVDLAVGLLFAFVALLFLLFYPVDFATRMMPLDTLIAFAVGFGLARLVPPLRRLGLSRRARFEATTLAAKAAFLDLGVSRTTGRTGVLVYAALFEKCVAIVSDVGVSEAARAAAEEARAELDDALAKMDIAAFARTLEALGPRFGTTMARADDDVNELPDEIV